MRSRKSRVVLALGMVVTTGLALSACSSSSTTPAPAASADASGVDLAAAGCPATVVIQTDWNPEAEHGMYYELLGPNPTIDSSKKLVSGPLYSQGKATGVNVEVRAGGPAIGYQGPVTQMYTDPSITLAFSATDGDIAVSASTPSIGVVAPSEKNPQMIMWDPATYPNVKTIADLGKTDAIVRYFGGATYMTYLTSTGLLKASQVDGGYDGTPANFVAAGGKDAQQGFASAEPYIYENEVADWMKPVAYQLISDTGYDIYASQLDIRKDDLEKMTPCLTKLVPVIQQATVDYFASPDAVNSLIVKLVEEYNTGWTYSEAIAKYADETQLKTGVVGNGPDSTVGNFDADRVSKIFDIVSPILTAAGTAPAAGLKATDLYTNQFIDPSIGFK